MGVRKEHIRFSRHITRGSRWRALRMAIIERDGGKCVQCGARGRLEVDHIEPVRLAPRKAWSPDNLQALCPRCHTKKTRIECGHKPPDPRREAWKQLVRTTGRNLRAMEKTNA